MRSVLVALLIPFLSSPAQAQAPDAEVLCPAFGEVARAVMTARQNAVPLTVMLATAPDTGAANLNAALMQILALAYAEAIEPDAESRLRAVTDFELRIVSQCETLLSGVST